ncbi:MAG: biopolymer transporter ExbD [bacterium]
MARKKRMAEWEAGELNLTAMIDVAFQLLNFFVITTHPVDVFANLDVFRPQAEKVITKQEEEPPPMLEVMIFRDGFAMGKRPMELLELDRKLEKIAGIEKGSMIVIKCTGDSTQAGLVSVLDLCAKHALSKISIFSL